MPEPLPAARWAAPHVPDLHAYVPGEQPQGGGWTKLNTNELPYAPSPRVAPAIAAELASLPKYPQPQSRPLREAIAATLALEPRQVIIGNGSDDLLNLLVRAFGHEGVGQTHPSYSLYPVLAAIRNARVASADLAPAYRLPVEALAQLPTRLLFLTTPNAPTGVAFPLADLRALLEGFDGLVVADEAYADFAEETALPLLREFPNLLITRTFSKSFGLAGLRVGFALGDPSVIDLLDRVRDSYNVNRLSQAGALAAWQDQAYLEEVVGRVVATRERVKAALDQRGWFYYPSQTNFLLLEPRTPAGETGAVIARSCMAFLQAQRILVRYFGSSPLTDRYLRVSIGTDQQMDALLAAFDAWQRQNA